MELRRVSSTVPDALSLKNAHAFNGSVDSPAVESHNPAMVALLDAAKRAAMGHTTILLTGESGTGKDVLARQIHQWSSRREGPFVLINCTALTEQLLETELFGHVRGAFTGAIKDKAGRLEAAGGGTVFFDEVAELPNSIQTRLLRFVQEQTLERMGDNQTLRVDARIIAASKKNLEEEVAAHRFREDLYYRLNVISMRLPALRERIDDIPSLASSILEEIRTAITHPPRLRLTPEAIGALVDYRWPGNIRELHNALERAATLARTDEIRVEDLPEKISHYVSPFSKSGNGMRLREREREYILRVLAESPSLDQAAATLGINVVTLWRKRKRYGIR
jgi:NtrC-family two-component system response regulator AlgB